VNLGLSSKKLQKAVKYADKNNYSHIVILWPQEQAAKNYILKDLKTGTEETISL
jgi:histidyl-tRNA synthetase